MITKKQMDAIKYLIIKSADASEFAKKLCFRLLDASNFLTKAVSISLTEGETGYERIHPETVWNGVHDMLSSNCNTHLGAIMISTGNDFQFMVHSGKYDESGKLVNAKRANPISFTVWLSPKRHDDDAEKVLSSRKEIEQIKLVSELYAT